MPETAQSDEAVLGITEDGPSFDTSSESLTSAPVETQPEATETEAPLSPDQAKDESLTAPKQADKAQQTAKPATNEGTPEQAQDYAQLFPQGIEQAREVYAKATELDRADQAFASGDVAGMAETFQSIFGENPAACSDALWMGLRFLEQYSPEHLSNFSRMVVSDQLGQQGVWNALEAIYESAQRAGAQETLALLNQLAGGLRQTYGLGPKTAEAQAADWQGYEKYLFTGMERSLNAEIRRSFGAKFNSVAPADQRELAKAAILATVDLLKKDTKLNAALQALEREYSVQEGLDFYYQALQPRVRALVPMVKLRLEREYADLFKSSAPARPQQPTAINPVQQAPDNRPKSMAEARAKKMTMGETLRSVQGEWLDTEHPLTVDEVNAKGMSYEEIMADPRKGQPRKPSTPISVFDEATP